MVFLFWEFSERANAKVKRHAFGHDCDDDWELVVLSSPKNFKFGVCWEVFGRSVNENFIEISIKIEYKVSISTQKLT